MDLSVHINEKGLARGISPVTMPRQGKIEALRQALDQWQFDGAFGRARRDEEKSRAKKRIFSHRSTAHAWDSRNQRPELWNLCCGPANR
jgi:sulfate adenylyltransferase subunit 2